VLTRGDKVSFQELDNEVAKGRAEHVDRRYTQTVKTAIMEAQARFVGDQEDSCADNMPNQMDCVDVCDPEPLAFRSDRHLPNPNEAGAIAQLSANPSGRDRSLRHVRYEIGEHPLADIMSLSGGNSPGAPIFVAGLASVGKASEAGVCVGDELVAVSGRPDFQQMGADRLLETLPTPTLLVFARDSAASIDPRQFGRLMTAAEKAHRTATAFQAGGAQQPPQHSEGGIAEGGQTKARAPTWLADSKQKEEMGFAGASWEVGDNPEPAFLDDKHTSLYSKASAGLTDVVNNAAKSGMSIVQSREGPRQDDGMIGLPTGLLSFFGPDTQVKVCEQVIFHPGVALLIEGQEPSSSSTFALNHHRSSPAIPTSGTCSEAPQKGSSSWMYELPQKEARRMVETAKRAAAFPHGTTSIRAKPKPHNLEHEDMRSVKGDSGVGDGGYASPSRSIPTSIGSPRPRPHSEHSAPKHVQQSPLIPLSMYPRNAMTGPLNPRLGPSGERNTALSRVEPSDDPDSETYQASI
jgi:hypothetical protein